MKRRIILVFGVLLILLGIFVLVRIAASTLAPKGKGALQVTTNVKASVYLNNKSIGAAPLCLCEQDQTITQGVHELKIIPDDKNLDPYLVKVDINPNVLTAVERTFLPGALASSYVLTLEKTSSRDPQLFIASVPDGALISIDGESKNVTPYTQNSISASEHEVEISKPGFSKKTIRVRAVPFYKLILNIVLGTDSGLDETLSTTPAISETISPTPSPAPDNSVQIKDTPTGFLRVREAASTGANEIGRVNPGEVYEFVDENTSWYQIKLKDGSTGWISKTYAQLINQ